MDAKSLISSFSSFLRFKNYSENTIRAYMADIREFITFLKAQGISANQAGKREIILYLASLTDRKLSPTTSHRKAESIKSFFSFLREIEERRDNPTVGLKLPRLPRREPRYLSEDEYQRLRSIAHKHSLTYYTIVELTLQTGLRISEVCNLELAKDLILTNAKKRGKLIIRGSKNGKTRVVSLNSKAVSAVRKYLRIRPANSTHPQLFLTSQGKPFKPRNLNHVTRKCFKEAEIQGATYHSLRHTFASHSLNKGSSIKTIQEALGHSSLSTTQIYTHMVEGKMEEDLERNAL